MSAEWAARDEQPILSISTNPCITRAAGTQGVKIEFNTCKLVLAAHNQKPFPRYTYTGEYQISV
jgi:hypothetical protein